MATDIIGKKLLILGANPETANLVRVAQEMGVTAIVTDYDSNAPAKKVAKRYREALKDVPGIRFFDDMPGVRHNYSCFPVFINAEEYGTTRDELYFKMKEQNVLGRRYFYPLISTFSTYRGLSSAAPENLPVATRLANEVICLPMHHELSEDDLQRVLNCIVG